MKRSELICLAACVFGFGSLGNCQESLATAFVQHPWTGSVFHAHQNGPYSTPSSLVNGKTGHQMSFSYSGHPNETYVASWFAANWYMQGPGPGGAFVGSSVTASEVINMTLDSQGLWELVPAEGNWILLSNTQSFTPNLYRMFAYSHLYIHSWGPEGSIIDSGSHETFTTWRVNYP